MRNAGRRITRAMIIEHVWNLSFDTATNVVDVYVNYATAQVDKKKMNHLASAIKLAFEQMGSLPSDAQSALLEPPVVISAAIPKPSPEIRLATSQNEELAELRKQLEKALAQEIARGEVAVHDGPDGLVISLREAGFFDSGSAGMKAGSQSALARIAAILMESKSSARIEGYTDNVPIHNSQYVSNWELSTARATEMIRLLIQAYGYDPQKLSASGYGQYHPIATNSSDAGRALNRRVDVVILRKSTGDPTSGPNTMDRTSPTQ
jgi:chemotaxis protein MotB